MSFRWNVHYWLYWKLPSWQLLVQPLTKVSSKIRDSYFSEINVVNYSFLLKYLLWGVTQSAYKPLTHINTPYTFPLRTDISFFFVVSNIHQKEETLWSRKKKKRLVWSQELTLQKNVQQSQYTWCFGACMTEHGNTLLWTFHGGGGGGGGGHRSLIFTRHNCTGTTKFHIHGIFWFPIKNIYSLFETTPWI